MRANPWTAHIMFMLLMQWWPYVLTRIPRFFLICLCSTLFCLSWDVWWLVACLHPKHSDNRKFAKKITLIIHLLFIILCFVKEKYQNPQSHLITFFFSYCRWHTMFLKQDWNSSCTSLYTFFSELIFLFKHHEYYIVLVNIMASKML